MTASRSFRAYSIAVMLGTIAVTIAWLAYFGWQEWPKWKAVREVRVAVELADPKQFLDAIDSVDRLHVSASAAEAVAPLRHHPNPRVRVYAVIGLAILRPRDNANLRDLTDLFDDSTEEMEVRCAAAPCMVLFGKESQEAVPSLQKAVADENDRRRDKAITALCQLRQDVPVNRLEWGYRPPPKRDSTMRQLAQFSLKEAEAH